MKKTSLLMLLAIGIMVIQCGCGSKDMARTGFLSDYSQLQRKRSTPISKDLPNLIFRKRLSGSKHSIFSFR